MRKMLVLIILMLTIGGCSNERNIDLDIDESLIVNDIWISSEFQVKVGNEDNVTWENNALIIDVVNDNQAIIQFSYSDKDVAINEVPVTEHLAGFALFYDGKPQSFHLDDGTFVEAVYTFTATSDTTHEFTVNFELPYAYSELMEFSYVFFRNLDLDLIKAKQGSYDFNYFKNYSDSGYIKVSELFGENPQTNSIQFKTGNMSEYEKEINVISGAQKPSSLPRVRLLTDIATINVDPRIGEVDSQSIAVKQGRQVNLTLRGIVNNNVIEFNMVVYQKHNNQLKIVNVVNKQNHFAMPLNKDTATSATLTIDTTDLEPGRYNYFVLGVGSIADGVSSSGNPESSNIIEIIVE